MAEYHVGHGLTGIYAGTLKPHKNPNKPLEWKNKTLVTNEATEAVRDWMVFDCLGGFDCSKGKQGGYAWDLKDGGTVKLLVSIEKYDAAISSSRGPIREQVEKVWGYGRVNLNPIYGGYEWECPNCHEKACRTKKQSLLFCPDCGCPMTDEAVDIILRRLEALNDNSTD